MDYFLILGAIIGVGFASGKEICVFFFDFGGASLIGLVAFGLLYIYLFFVIQYISHKLKVNSYDSFNAAIFGKMCKFTKIIMLINFTITSAGMLAGADYLFETFFGIGYKIPSIVLSVLTFILLIGGINKIKLMANIIIPVMLAVIVINSLHNITPQNVHMEITVQNGVMAVYYGLLFGVNNFVAAMPMLFETKLKTKGKLAVILSICLVILLNILVFASNNFSTAMPMFELSSNVSPCFYYIYFTTLVMALFSTLVICSYNANNIVSHGKKSLFTIGLVVLTNLIISNLGYDFIVQYLYVVSGIISGIYVISLVVMIIVKLIKLNSEKKNNCHNIGKNSEIKSCYHFECSKKIYIKKFKKIKFLNKNSLKNQYFSTKSNKK
ncbi:MAG: hypothetical protein IJ415_02200 [Clostridia bacterium]|nr:hypothetical protein [Clostridia bacterium]